MDASDDSRGQRAGSPTRDRNARCAVCGGELNVIVEVPPNRQPYAQDHPSTKYFRCARCGQIEIVDA
jgi:uncharacterized protein with PIN domain